MANYSNTIKLCTACVEGQRKEDNFRIRQTRQKVFYSFQLREGEDEEEADREIFVCDHCHFMETEKLRDHDWSNKTPAAWYIQPATEWMARRDAGLTQFDGSLFLTNGRVNIPRFNELREQSSRLRTLDNRGVQVTIPMELSDEACRRPFIREFYGKYRIAAGIVIQPGESHKQALGRQDPWTQEVYTIRLRHQLDDAILWENWDKARELFNLILDVDPLTRRPSSPALHDDGDEPEPKRPRRDGTGDLEGTAVRPGPSPKELEE